jgi:hypothetical protein
MELNHSSMGYKSNVAGLLGKPSMYIFELNDES